jgi:alpha-glucosidase
MCCSQRKTLIHVLSQNLVRVTHAPPGVDDFPFDRRWTAQVLLPYPALPREGQPVRVISEDGRVQAFSSDGSCFFEEAEPPEHAIRRRRPYISLDIPNTELHVGLRRVEQGIRLVFSTTPGERFYGWGEWFNAFERQRGRKPSEGTFRLEARNPISQLQAWQTYSTIPFFLSSRGYGLLLLNAYPSRWHIDPTHLTLTVEADGPGVDYILIYGPSFKKILASYTALTGRPPLLPRWAFGLWTTSYPQCDQRSVLAHVQEHRKRDIPLDAVILDYHWEQRFHNFHWRKELIPDPDGLLAALSEQGVRLGLILTPFLNNKNRPFQKWLLNILAHNLPPGMEKDDERALPDYEAALARGYLAHPNARWWFGQGGIVDFTNPQAARWWNDQLRPLYQQGVAFFKNDDGESLPDDAHSALGMDGREYHNLYGFFYGKALYEGMIDHAQQDIPPAEKRRPLIYARSAWAGSQRYPALFLGDQQPTFKCLRRTLRAGLNMSLLGFAYWTADVFGLEGKTNPETHMRYAQWALMVPIARYFWRPPHIDDTRLPWSHNGQVEANFRKYAQLRYRLLPYYVWLAWEAYQTGLPILRPMLLEFQDDPRLAGIYDQVMLGDRLMLCPVVQAGATRRQVILPEGIWHEFELAETRLSKPPASWAGPSEIEVLAPLDHLPLFVRGGTILPLGPPGWQCIPDNHRFDPLWLHCWPPYPAQAVLYEDDGRTLAYREGEYALTHILLEENGNRQSLRISAAEGSFAGQLETRQVELALHYSPEPHTVRVNSRLYKDWHYNPQARITTVHLHCPVGRETLVEVDSHPFYYGLSNEPT